MSWYRTGTVSVTNGSAVVTGAGTSFIAGVAIGESFNGPDGKLYEIQSVDSNLQITLASPYLGATAAAQLYVVIPTQSYIRDLASQAAALVANYATIASNQGAGKFADGTVTNPGIEFINENNTGLRRVAANTMAMVVGGVDRLTLSATAITAALAVAITAGAAAAPSLAAAGNLNTGLFFPAANQVAVAVAGAEGLRLTSTGLSVGTTVQQGRLSVQGDIYTRDGGVIYVQNADNSNNYYFQNVGPTGAANGALAFVQGGVAVRATLDAVGNFGLGVTPSVWSAAYSQKAIQFGPVGSLSSLSVAAGNQQVSLGNNAFDMAAGGKYITTDFATLYEQNAGAHYWFNAPSGTAGTAISFTQAMTLDANGNLGLGVTPSAWSLKSLQIANGGLTAAVGGAETDLSNNAYYNAGWKYTSSNYATLYSQSNSSHLWYTAVSGTAGATITFTQAMTLDLSGNLLLGVTAAGTSAAHVLGLSNATAPTTSPAGMGQLYVEAGALKYRGSSGTITTLAAA